MAKRRRLGPAGPLDITPLETKSAIGAPPIAQVVAQAAGAGENALKLAQDAGRLLLDIPLENIAAEALLRDRIGVDDTEMVALTDSLRDHGQRTPIEVMESAGDAPYALISGWRRLTALKALYAETGEDRFAKVRAILRQPDSSAEAYTAMVEENEIRVGLSYYERARLAVRAAELGVFADADQAVNTLFKAGSAAKRSKIRAFMPIYRELGTALRFPTHIAERLGLMVSEALKAGQGARLRGLLEDTPCEDANAEASLLKAALSKAPPAPSAPMGEELGQGIRMEVRQRADTLALRLSGVSPAQAEKLLALIKQELG